MTSVGGPRKARHDEFSELCELVDRVFNQPRGGLPANRPHAYVRTNFDHHAIIKEGGEIVSQANCIPRSLVEGDSEVPCWGIGGVATDKRRRSQGYISALLEFWVEEVEAAGVSLSELGGNRRRYNYFGWETNGRARVYTVTDRLFPGASVPEANIEHYRGTASEVDFVKRIHDDERLRGKRDRETYEAVLSQRNLETVLHTGPESPAYVSFTRRGTDRSLLEYGGGPDGVQVLLAYLFRKYETDEVEVPIHPLHDLAPLFEEMSGERQTRPYRLLRINDLLGVLEGFSELMNRRWASSGRTGDGALVLGIGKETKAVEISHTSMAVSLSATEHDPDVELDRQEMTRLPFGSFRACRSVKDEHPLLARVTPLNSASGTRLTCGGQDFERP